MTTQDTGLVEECMRAAWYSDGPESCVPYEDASDISIDCLRSETRAVLIAILPHLSPESQALLRKELGDG